VFYYDFLLAATIDISVLTISTILLLKYGRLTHSHPALAYLLFHGLVISSRLLAIMAGAQTLFSELPGIWEPVTESEIVRAVFLADVTLATMTVAWIRASVVDAIKYRHTPPLNNRLSRDLSLHNIWRVTIFTFPLGVIGLSLLGNIPGLERPELDLGEWQTSSWTSITVTWAGLSLLALIYWYGFRLWLTVPMAIYLGIMAIQGSLRFRFVIPLILLLQIYLDRRGKKWPSPIIMAILAVAILLFFPMKTIGRMTMEGATLSEITEISSDRIRDAISGQHGDQEILDQFATTLTLIDQSGRFYYGGTYLALISSPIPRPLWPDKPGLADGLKDISTPLRPMAELGMVMTFMGEFYINFGLPGIIFLSYLLAFWLGRMYYKAYRGPYYSVIRFSYLLVACNLIQIYRDGLVSLVIFTFVHMMPLAFIIMLHLLLPKKQSARELARTAPAGYPHNIA
jgi:oligosaccharide repeat unit polymerase